MTDLRTIAGKALNPVGLGCMNVARAYGSAPSRGDARELFRLALDSGCNHFDTANIYGMGLSEEILGEAIASRRDEFFLATKTGIIADGDRRGVDCSPEAITASLDASLKRLKVDHVDLFYMHRFDPAVPIADSVGAMVRAIEAGKIGAYGVSEWSSAHIREAHAAHPLGAVQTEYSLWTRNVELGVLDTTKELGIALVAFSPLGRGALTGRLGDPGTLEEDDMRRRMPRFDAGNWPHNHALIERLDALARDEGVTAGQLALGWVLSRGGHVHVIPGTGNPAHLIENLGAGACALSQAVIEQAGAIINHATVAGHRYPDAMRRAIDTEDYG